MPADCEQCYKKYTDPTEQKVEDGYFRMIGKVFQPSIEKKPWDRNGNDKGYPDPADKLFIQ